MYERERKIDGIRTAPLVSVIMPAYNAEKYIEEAVSSVLSQTYKNWELLILDDCWGVTTRLICGVLCKP